LQNLNNFDQKKKKKNLPKETQYCDGLMGKKNLKPKDYLGLISFLNGQSGSKHFNIFTKMRVFMI